MLLELKLIEYLAILKWWIEQTISFLNESFTGFLNFGEETFGMSNATLFTGLAVAFSTIVFVHFLIQVVINRSEIVRLPYIFFRLLIGHLIITSVCLFSLELTSVILVNLAKDVDILGFSLEFLNTFGKVKSIDAGIVTDPNSTSDNFAKISELSIALVPLAYFGILLKVSFDLVIRKLFLQLLFVFSVFVPVFDNFQSGVFNRFWKAWFDPLIRNITLSLAYLMATSMGKITLAIPNIESNFSLLLLILSYFLLIPFATNKITDIFLSEFKNFDLNSLKQFLKKSKN
jgi:hypothetical protein